jgi:hypothetical protein
MNGSIAYFLVFILTLFPYNLKAQETPFYLLTKDEPLPQKNTEAKDLGAYVPKVVPYADWLIRRAEIVRRDLLICQQEYVQYKDDLTEKGKIELNWVMLKTKKKLDYLVFLENKFKALSGVSFADAGYDYGFDSIDSELSELKEKAFSYVSSKKYKLVEKEDKSKAVAPLAKEVQKNEENDEIIDLVEFDSQENSEAQDDKANQTEDLVKEKATEQTKDQVFVEKTKSDSVELRSKLLAYSKKVYDFINSKLDAIFKKDKNQKVEQLESKEMALALNEGAQSAVNQAEVSPAAVIENEPKAENGQIKKDKKEAGSIADREKSEELKVLKAKIKKCETKLEKTKKENESIKREISSLKNAKNQAEMRSLNKEADKKENKADTLPLSESSLPVKELIEPSAPVITVIPETAPIDLSSDTRLEQNKLEEEKQKLKERESALAEYEKKLKEIEESIKKEKEESARIEQEERLRQEELAKAKAAEEKRINEEREAKLAKEREEKEKEEKIKALVEEEKRLSIELIEKRKQEIESTYKKESSSLPELEQKKDQSEPVQENKEKDPVPSEVKEDKKKEQKELELEKIVNKEESPVIEQDSNKRTRIIEDGELQEANGPKF